MRILFTVLLAMMCMATSLYGQAGPFTNNTLNTACVETNPTDELQFQFNPEYAWSTKSFDAEGNLQDSDEVSVESGLGLQFNNGFTDKLEWGVALPIDVSELSLGLKYNIFGEGKFMTALATWVDMPTGSRSYAKNSKSTDDIALAGFGAVFQYNVSDKFIVYTDIYGQKFLQEVEQPHDLNFMYNLDLDYALTDGVRAAAGFAYSNSMFEAVSEVGEDDNNESLGTLSYGLFFEKWDSWNIYVAHYFDVMGENTDAYNTLTFNITRTFK